jgi:hypothetical protein
VNHVQFIHWYKDGLLHREDGPAVEGPFGQKYWLQHGEFHREDGPAVIWPNGAQEWYLKGIQYTKEEFKIITTTTTKKLKP